MMNRITKIFVVAVLSAIASSNAIFAAFPNDQSHADSDQYTTDTGGERAYQTNARDRFNRLRQENRSMMNQDRRMMRDGYDANEGQGSPQGSYAPSTSDSSAPRGQRMQQGGYYGPKSSRTTDGQRQQTKEGYDLGRVDANDRHPTYEYVLGKDGQWRHIATHHDDSQVGQSDANHNDTHRLSADNGTPASYPFADNDSHQNNPTAYDQHDYSDQEYIGDSTSDKSRSSIRKKRSANLRDQSNDSTSSSSTTKRTER